MSAAQASLQIEGHDAQARSLHYELRKVDVSDGNAAWLGGSNGLGVGVAGVGWGTCPQTCPRHLAVLDLEPVSGSQLACTRATPK